MGLGDSIRRFFSKRASPDLSALEAFARSHKGVEGFIEPRTATNPTTLLLVDREGESVRGAVREPEDAAAFCEGVGIPVYDAGVIGYPKRMRDFDARKRRGSDPSIDEAFADIERRFNEEAGPGTPDR